MSNYAQSFTQFNVKVVGEERVKVIEAAREYCAKKQITISEFVVAALKSAVELELLPESNPTFDDVRLVVEQSLEPIKMELDELRSRLDVIESQRTESPSNSLELLDSQKLETATTGSNTETSELIQRLEELLDSERYPANNGSRIRKRLSEIISEIR